MSRTERPPTSHDVAGAVHHRDAHGRRDVRTAPQPAGGDRIHHDERQPEPQATDQSGSHGQSGAPERRLGHECGLVQHPAGQDDGIGLDPLGLDLVLQPDDLIGQQATLTQDLGRLLLASPARRDGVVLTREAVDLDLQRLDAVAVPLGQVLRLLGELLLPEGQVRLGELTYPPYGVVLARSQDLDAQHARRCCLGDDRPLQVVGRHLQPQLLSQLLRDGSGLEQRDVGRHRGVLVRRGVMGEQQRDDPHTRRRDEGQPRERERCTEQRAAHPDVPEAKQRAADERDAHRPASGQELILTPPGGVVLDAPGRAHDAPPVHDESRNDTGRVPPAREGSGCCCMRSCGSSLPVVLSSGSGSATTTPEMRKPAS